MTLPTQYSTVAQVVCGRFDVTLAEMQSDARPERIVLVRQVTWYLLRTITNSTLDAISEAAGYSYGGVRHGVVHVCDLISTDREFAETVTLLESRCRVLLENNQNKEQNAN